MPAVGAVPKPGAERLSERGLRWIPNERVSPDRAIAGGRAEVRRNNIRMLGVLCTVLSSRLS